MQTGSGDLSSAAGNENPAIGLYVHFPYCLQKCAYCDFFSVGLLSSGKQVKGAGSEQLVRFATGLLAELDARAESLSARTIDSVYFGGGPASLMPAEVIARILDAVRTSASLAQEAEITVEGNPENFTGDYLKQLHEIGITRVNVGIQTFNGRHLEAMNRLFNEERCASILEDLSSGPISNFGLDLIYGFPGQSRTEFENDLRRCLEARPAHLSVYSLTAEENTPYYAAVERGVEKAPEEDLQCELFEALPALLRPYGLHHYEVSNFARSGSECRHNLHYWNYEPYIGLGPGAHGFDGRLRYANPRNIAAWEAAPAVAPLAPHEPQNDIPLMMARLCGWISLDQFRDVARSGGLDAVAALKATRRLVQNWNRQGYCELNPDGERFRWRPAGLLDLDSRIAEWSSELTASLAIPASP